MLSRIKKFFTKPNIQFNTGLLNKDPLDTRDYLLSSAQPLSVALPENYILRDKQTPVQNQQNFGICYSMAATGIAEFWNSAEYSTFINLSERFTAHYTKTLSGLWDQQGDYFRYAVKAICDYGICKEEKWPNDFDLTWHDFIRTKPPETIKKEAEEFKGKTYWRVDGKLENIKQAIYQNKTGVLVGMGWFSSYNATPINGLLPMPSGTQSGHAIICVGWENNKLWFKNSWGINWGNQGYFYIPFEDFDKHDIWDAWILLDLPKQNNMLKIIGSKANSAQYVQGKDGVLHHILNQVMLEDLANSGVVDKNQVEWIDNVNDGFSIGNPWCPVKNF